MIDCVKYRFALPLRKPLKGGTPSQAIREGILIHLRSPDGFEGWGQGMSHNGVITDANEAVVAEVALDAARADLASQQTGMSLCDWLKQVEVAPPRTASPKTIPVNALISGANPEEVAEAGNLAANSGFSTVKLKVGGSDIQSDIARVRALREAVGAKVAIRLDANGAWSSDEALGALKSLATFDVEYVEEPTAGRVAIGELATLSPIPVAADESIKSLADLSSLPELAIPVAVIKPAVLGNLCELLSASQKLLDEGVKVVVSSALDSSIGIACAAHFAAALGLGDTPCGLATADWLSEDLASALEIANGHIILTDASGIGLTADPEALNRLIEKTSKIKA